MVGIKSRGGGTFVKSISISPEFFYEAQENKISLSEAVRVGISVILAEKGVKQYDNRLNLYRKMRVYQAKVEALGADLEKIKAQMEVKNDANN